MRLPKSYALTQKLFCFPTVGDGNCGIHAMFGEWNNAYRGIFSSNAAERRSVVAKKIATCPIDSPLFSLLIEPMTTMIQDFVELPENFNWLKTAYDDALAEIDATTSACKSRFIALLPSVEAGLREIYSVYLNEKQGAVNYPPKDLFAMFSICIAEKETETMIFLEGRRELKDAYNAYIESSNKTVSVASILDDDELREGVLEEYACYINADQEHLLPSELQIFAFVYDKHVVYYPSLEASENHFNPTGSDTITIVFDGINHYEKAFSNEERKTEMVEYLLHNAADAQIADILESTPEMRVSSMLDTLGIFNKYKKGLVPRNTVVKEEIIREEPAELFFDSVIYTAMQNVSEKTTATPTDHVQQHDEAKSKADETERFITTTSNTMFARAMDRTNAKKVTFEDKNQHKKIAPSNCMCC